jgi:hypothetical protein
LELIKRFTKFIFGGTKNPCKVVIIMNKVTVVGSINLDTNLRVKRMVKPGETIHAKEHYLQAAVRVLTRPSLLLVPVLKRHLSVRLETMLRVSK